MRPSLIAHVLFRLDYGGMENGLVNLLNRLPVGNYRHAVICLTDFTSFRDRINDPDIAVHAIAKQPGQDPRAYLRLRSLFRQIRPQIVHTRNTGVLDCAFVAAASGVPIRVHGYHGWDIDDLHGMRLKRRVFRRALHPFVTRFVTVSEDLRAWLVKNEGVAEHRIEQIYNGVDTDRFSPSDSPVQAADGRIRIGTVGRLQEVKNQALLVDAIGQLLRRRADLQRRIAVSLIGDGATRGALEARIAGQGLADVISITGFRDDIPAAMQGLDVFVLPSLNEGISNTILEAMAAGLPVIATRVGGNSELVRDGTSGALVSAENPAEMSDALERYCDDASLRARHGAHARALAEERFSLEAMAAAYDGLYRGLLKA